jgi:hypothetical protein
MIKLQYPIKDFKWGNNISQLFGVNRDLYYKNFGLEGHNGLDISVGGEKQGYGEPILAAHDGIVKDLVYETEWKTKGNGIYLESLDGSFRTIYWHLSEIQVRGNQQVKQGEVIGLMGNTGFVRPEVTPQYPRDGTHLHFSVAIKGKQSEYGDFVDPTPYLIREGDRLPIYFARDLYYGRSGDDVSFLQTCLKLELGEEVDFEPIGYFGGKTMTAVRKLQEKYFLTPTIGYCGPKTRRFLIERWSVFPYGYLLGKAFEI